jgi:ribonuclease Z
LALSRDLIVADRSPLTVSSFRHGDLSLVGVSVAGDQTWFRVSPPGVAFDVGRGATELSGVDRVFLTHGHLDHALGLPFLLSQRAAAGAKAIEVFAPAPIIESLRRFLAAAADLEGRSYAFELQPVTAGGRVELGAGLSIEPFAVSHRSPALGYHLMREKRHLLEACRGLAGAEIAQLRARGEEVEVVERERWLSYTGDTTGEVFDLSPEIFDATVLLIECTFLLERHRESARDFGHLHLDELVARQERFRNRALVLAHLSRRHRVAELETAVAARLPALRGRVHVLGGTA